MIQPLQQIFLYVQLYHTVVVTQFAIFIYFLFFRVPTDANAIKIIHCGRVFATISIRKYICQQLMQIDALQQHTRKHHICCHFFGEGQQFTGPGADTHCRTVDARQFVHYNQTFRQQNECISNEYGNDQISN